MYLETWCLVIPVGERLHQDPRQTSCEKIITACIAYANTACYNGWLLWSTCTIQLAFRWLCLVEISFNFHLELFLFSFFLLEEVEQTLETSKRIGCCDDAPKFPRGPVLFDSSTPLKCHIIRHAKKENCNNSATKNDFELIFPAKDGLSHIVYDLKISQFWKTLTREPVL